MWWLGFDCAHAFDLSPAMEARMRELMPNEPRMRSDVYRDLGYVQGEVASLAAQAQAAT